MAMMHDAWEAVLNHGKGAAVKSKIFFCYFVDVSNSNEENHSSHANN